MKCAGLRIGDDDYLFLDPTHIFGIQIGGEDSQVAWADENAKVRLQLPKETEQREVKDVAVFLACSSPEHVPDLWRSKTPLGRDMVSVPRHEMLAFVAGDTPAGKAPRLTLPERLEADVDETEPHDLILGVAARIGDRWVQLAFTTIPKTKIETGQKPPPVVSSAPWLIVHFKVEQRNASWSATGAHETSFETPASST